MEIPKFLESQTHIIIFINQNTTAKIFKDFAATLTFFKKTHLNYKYIQNSRTVKDAEKIIVINNISLKLLDLVFEEKDGKSYIRLPVSTPKPQVYSYYAKTPSPAQVILEEITRDLLGVLMEYIPLEYYENQLKDYFPRCELKRLENSFELIKLMFPAMDATDVHIIEIYLDELLKHSNLFRDMYKDTKEYSEKIETDYNIPVPCTHIMKRFLIEMFKNGSTQYIHSVYPTRLSNEEFSNLIKIIDYLGIEFKC